MSHVASPERQLLVPPVEPADLVVVGPDVELHVGPWATSCVFETTYDSTATVTISLGDPENDAVLNQTDGFFNRDKQGISRISKWNTLTLHGSVYVLSELTRTTGGLDLVFYDAVSEILKRRFGAIKIKRGQATRAQVVAGMAHGAGVGWYVPDIAKRQPIADLAPADIKALHKTNATQTVKRKLATSDAKQAGLQSLRKARIKWGGKVLSNIQTQAIADALSVADDLQVNALARLALVCAGFGESGFDPRKTDYATHTHKGVFQSNQVPQFDTTQQAHYFLVGGHSFRAGGAILQAQKGSKLTPGQIAAFVEVSNGSGDYYDSFQDVAKKVLDAWSPGTGGGSRSDPRTGSPDRAFIQRFEFTVPAAQNWWEGTRRLADPVLWRRFALFNHLIFASDFTMAETTPYSVSENDSWFDLDVPWTVTRGAKIDQLPVSGRLESILPAGAAVAISDDGPTYGTWLVSRYARDLLDPLASFEMTLKRPVKPLPEPASTVKTVTGQAPSTSGTGLSGDAAVAGVAKAYAKAKAIDAKRYPYVFGGGHGRPGPPTTIGGRTGYDCSGGVCAVLAAGGFISQVITAQALTKWGNPGRGKYITVYAIDEGGGNGHCFMEFTLPNKIVFFEFHHTGTIGGFESSRDTAGFTARHFPGT